MSIQKHVTRMSVYSAICTNAVLYVATLCVVLAAATAQAWEYRPYMGPTANTVLLFHLNETSGSTVTNDNHANFDDVGDATIIGAPTQGVSSVSSLFGTAYATQPSNHVELRYYPSSGPATSDWNALGGDDAAYTFEAWVKWDPATSGAGRQALANARLMQGETATGNEWNLNLVRVSGNTVQLNMTALNTGQLNSSVVSWDSSLWHHIAFTKTYAAGGSYGLADFNLYITPANSASFPINVGTFNGQNDFRIPQSSGGAGKPANLRLWIGAGNIGAFSGLIDEVRISNAVMADFPASDRSDATLITLR